MGAMDIKYDAARAGNYDLDLVVSALQKSIRRGREPQALYWARILHKADYSEYCWRRLKIITSEDIGLAAPFMPMQIASLYGFWAEIKERHERSEFLYIAHAVMLLARAKKSRVVCDAASWFEDCADIVEPLSIPLEAIDQHTELGRSLGAMFEAFLLEGGKLENEDHSIPNPYALWWQQWLKHRDRLDHWKERGQQQLQQVQEYLDQQHQTRQLELPEENED